MGLMGFQGFQREFERGLVHGVRVTQPFVLSNPPAALEIKGPPSPHPFTCGLQGREAYDHSGGGQEAQGQRGPRLTLMVLSAWSWRAWTCSLLGFGLEM